MSTIMHVVFNLSMFRNLLTTLCVVLLVSFSVSSLRLPDNRNVRSPDDRIVFPGEQAFNSEEQFGEDGKYYESKSFRHNPEFHGMHSFLPSPSDKTGPNLPHFHRRLKFHDDTVEYNNKTLNVVPLI
ncbi:hypothetical protein HHI36_011251 [Cryptolaemus montrouzieri]|uniref:Uncharacterized protein n=1 Tax=Cryptolaemus montrouzieri TaxID=559131 RepID=A0ABD2ML65_9CUCU